MKALLGSWPHSLAWFCVGLALASLVFWTKQNDDGLALPEKPKKQPSLIAPLTSQSGGPVAGQERINALEARLAKAHRKLRDQEGMQNEIGRLRTKLSQAQSRAPFTAVQQTETGAAEDEIYNPQAIESTGIPVTDETPLAVGDVLQVQWRGTTWWAAEVTGLENDGWVGIRYIGWSDSHNEIVPREHLQLDPAAREKARATRPR